MAETAAGGCRPSGEQLREAAGRQEPVVVLTRPPGQTEEERERVRARLRALAGGVRDRIAEAAGSAPDGRQGNSG